MFMKKMLCTLDCLERHNYSIPSRSLSAGTRRINCRWCASGGSASRSRTEQAMHSVLSNNQAYRQIRSPIYILEGCTFSLVSGEPCKMQALYHVDFIFAAATRFGCGVCQDICSQNLLIYLLFIYCSCSCSIFNQMLSPPYIAPLVPSTSIVRENVHSLFVFTSW